MDSSIYFHICECSFCKGKTVGIDELWCVIEKKKHITMVSIKWFFLYFIGLHSFSFARKLLTESSCYEGNDRPLIPNIWWWRCFYTFSFLFFSTTPIVLFREFSFGKNEQQLYNKGIKENDWCEPFSQRCFVFPLGLTIGVTYWMQTVYS